MRSFGLNHMTVRHASGAELLSLASATACAGVELRNDLAGQFLDGKNPKEIREAVKKSGLRILCLAEAYGFNDGSSRSLEDVDRLAGQAAELGAEGIALIPFKADVQVPRETQKNLIKASVTALRPILERRGIKGLIEPLGFETASLRFKSDVVDALDALGNPECFAIIHDTFHHALAGEAEVFAGTTQLVHISGVTRRTAKLTDLHDADRGLVEPGDVLGNLEQIAQLDAAGFRGAYSIEAFSPDVHEQNDPEAALSASFDFMTNHLAKMAA